MSTATATSTSSSPAGSEVEGGSRRLAGGPWLFRNDGPGRWTDVTAGSGLRHTGWAQGVAVADYDADGDLDLFVAQHGPDTLWQNQGDGTFRDVDRRGRPDRRRVGRRAPPGATPTATAGPTST